MSAKVSLKYGASIEDANDYQGVPLEQVRQGDHIRMASACQELRSIRERHSSIMSSGGKHTPKLPTSAKKDRDSLKKLKEQHLSN